MITLKDIADEAGVSIATISNVVNGNMSKVSPENARRIRKIIEKRRYVPNSSARTLAAKSSKIIAGILLGGQDINILKDPYSAEFFGELVCAVQERGYYLMIRYVNNYEEVIQSLRSWNVDGAVFIGTSDAYIRKINEEIEIPLIFTDSYTTQQEINNVGINDFKGGVLAAECFLRNGHNRPGFLGYTIMEHGKNVITERLDGFLSVFNSRGIKFGKEQIFYVSENDHERSIKKIAARLASGKDGVSGIFTSADKLAFALIKALLECGTRVPDDISVIGFDDLSITADLTPGLTTIKQNISRKVQIAADLLFAQIDGNTSPPLNTLLDVELVERGSVKLKKIEKNT